MINEPVSEVQGQERLPMAKSGGRRPISVVWLVPIVAFLVAGWLIWTTYRDQGPMVTVSFESAEGLEAGKTRIKYKDVDVGLVKGVELSDDLKQVVVTAQMTANAARFLRDGTSFWVVRPRIGAGGVSGLGTLVSGAYMEIDPSTEGEARSTFVGLEEPPLIRSEVPGRTFTLVADSLGSVGRGAPIYFRGIEVGQVLGFHLDDDKPGITIPIFIRAPHDSLVRDTTRFWNASGLTVSTGAGGVSVQMASVQALVTGGIEFETPLTVGGTQQAAADSSYPLFASRAAADDAGFTVREPYIADFEGSTRGLRPGAPVEIRGLRIGAVSDVGLVYDAAADRILVRALLEFEPGRLRAVDSVTGEPMPRQDTAELVAHGLRAQLKTGNLLTGDLFVDVDFHPDAPPARMTKVGEYNLIPTVPTQLDQLSASLTGILEKVSTLPLDELFQDLRGTVRNVQTLSGPDAKRLMDQVGATLASLQKVAGSAESELPATIASLRQTTAVAEAALRDIRGLVSGDSSLRYDLNQALKEMAGAARSIRSFADYLDRHPEALIRGRAGR